MSASIQSIRGFSDILPGETPTWYWVESVFRDELSRYGYHEIRLPLVEKTALFSRAIGEVTDIVEKEMYTFDDRNGESLTLRPEGTAGCLRAAIQQGLIHNSQPRLWYAGPMFRHERPQKGRYRQFHQIGAEVFGLPGPDIDAELIALTHRILSRGLGIENLRLEINNLGNAESRGRYRAALIGYLEEHLDALDEEAKRRLYTNPLRILDSKNPVVQQVIATAPDLQDFLDDADRAHFAGLRAHLQAAGVEFVVNSRLVRGLDYYGGTVFEWISDNLGAQGTVLAGGRYDALVEMIGGKPTPAIGFAAGIERLVALVTDAGQAQEVEPPHCTIVTGSADYSVQAMALAEHLRTTLPWLRLHLVTGGGSMKGQLRRADRSGAALALILGETEVAAQSITVKSLRGEQTQVTIEQQALAEVLYDRLANQIKERGLRDGV